MAANRMESIKSTVLNVNLRLFAQNECFQCVNNSLWLWSMVNLVKQSINQHYTNHFEQANLYFISNGNRNKLVPFMCVCVHIIWKMLSIWSDINRKRLLYIFIWQQENSCKYANRMNKDVAESVDKSSIFEIILTLWFSVEKKWININPKCDILML